MANALRTFVNDYVNKNNVSRAPAVNAPAGTGDGSEDPGSSAAPPPPDDSDQTTANQTDPSKLAAPDLAFVSPDGGSTAEGSPQPGVEYDFCLNIVNVGELPSGPFFVLFKLTQIASGEGMDWPPVSVDQEAGLDAKASVVAVAHFGQFPNIDASYSLSASVFSISANTQVTKADDFVFHVDAKSGSGSGGGGDEGAGGDGEGAGGGGDGGSGGGDDGDSGEGSDNPGGDDNPGAE
jgi:hypothetical protein